MDSKISDTKMNREEYLTQISDRPAILRCQIEHGNALNLYDINIVTKDFFQGVTIHFFRINLTKKVE